MDDKEIDKIVSYLRPEHKVFEWGCGGSTLYFSQYVSSYRSIEHNKKWYYELYKLKTPNIDLHHYSIKNNPDEYINAISNYPEQYDIILIDGRYRVKCALTAKKYLINNGILLVHDYFNRPYYSDIEKYYSLIDSIKDTEQTLAIFKNEIHN